VLYLRPGQLTEKFPEQVRLLQPTNPIVGTVLDLRFADGGDGAADAAMKLFAAKKTPLVILVNGQTRGAAADIAAQLRAANAGIIIGSTNAPEKILPDIAVNVSAGAEKIFMENPFASSPAASTEAGSPATNDLLPLVDHTTEAELVQKKIKDGEDDGDDLTPRAAPPQPVIRDPALARAVDLLKALAITQASRG
jgi:hypothetical protein